MKITKNQLRQIIKEELAGVLDEETAIGDVESQASKGAKLTQKIHGEPRAKAEADAKGWAEADKVFGQEDQPAKSRPESKATMVRKIDKVFGQED